MDANNDVDYELDPDPTISCEIDGVPVEDLFAYRAQSPPGGFVLASDALLVDFGLDPGPRFPAISDGYWLMLKGLGLIFRPPRQSRLDLLHPQSPEPSP